MDLKKTNCLNYPDRHMGADLGHGQYHIYNMICSHKRGNVQITESKCNQCIKFMCKHFLNETTIAWFVHFDDC